MESKTLVLFPVLLKQKRLSLRLTVEGASLILPSVSSYDWGRFESATWFPTEKQIKDLAGFLCTSVDKVRNSIEEMRRFVQGLDGEDSFAAVLRPFRNSKSIPLFCKRLAVDRETFENWLEGRSFPDFIHCRDIPSVFALTNQDLDRMKAAYDRKMEQIYQVLAGAVISDVLPVKSTNLHRITSGGLGQPIGVLVAFRVWCVVPGAAHREIQNEPMLAFADAFREMAEQCANKSAGHIREDTVVQGHDGKFHLLGSAIEAVTIRDIADIETAMRVAADEKNSLLLAILSA